MSQKKESFTDRLFLLNGDEFRLYNISVARFLGDIHAAIIFTELVSSRKHYSNENKLYEDEKNGDGWFFRTQEKIEERTCLTRKNQDHAIKILLDKGWIDKIVVGLPAKRYFKINDDKVLEGLNLSNKHSSLSKTDKLVCPKGTIPVVQIGQTAHYIEENKKENKLRERVPLIDFGEIVKLKPGEYEKLCEDNGKQKIDSMIITMNDYCASKGERYKDYAATLRNWIRREKDKKQDKKNENPKESARERQLEAYTATNGSFDDNVRRY
jgi:hypothetical protein